MLSRSILTLMIPVPLILFGLAAAFFIEYQKHQVGVAAFGGERLTPVQYVKLRIDTYRQQTEAKAAVAELDIRDTLPPAPEGWTRSRYEVAHGDQITGVTFKPSMVVKDTEKSIQDSFRAVKRRQKNAVTASYIKGDEIIAVKIKAIPAIDGTTLEGKLAKRLAQVAVFADEQEPDAVFTVADDIAFTQLPQISRHIVSGKTRPVEYRRFEGGIGKQLNIFVFSNASDTAILDVIHGIDFAALKTFAKISKAVAVHADPELGGVNATQEEIRAAAAKALSDALGTDQADGATQDQPPQAAAIRAAAAQAQRIAEQVAAGGVAAPAESAQPVSFRDRLKGLLGGGTSGSEAQETPKKTVCSVKQGFKRCVFVEE